MSRRNDQRGAYAPRRAAKTPAADTRWVGRFAEALRASGDTVFTLDHPLFVEYGIDEQHARQLCHGTGGFGLLTMEAVFAGPSFSHYEWRIG